jgi:tetratricopeptide (TPR) repeat protein
MTLIIESPAGKAGIEALWDSYQACPDSAASMALAQQLWRRGSYGEAAEICSRAKSDHPGYVSCRVLLGRCLMGLGFKEQALRELEEVLELDRENAFSLRAMAELRSDEGNLAEAADYYRALVRIDPSDLEMQQRLAEIVRALELGAEEVAPTTVEPDVNCEGPETSIEESEGWSLVEITAPETLTQAWHLEDEASAMPVPQSFAAQEPGVKSEADQQPSAVARRTGREAAQFFNYSNRHSDISLFAQWVEQERKCARKENCRPPRPGD